MTFKQIILTASLTLLCLVALAVLLRPRPAYSEQITPTCRLSIHINRASQGRNHFRVTFHNPPAIGLYAVHEIDLPSPTTPWRFRSFVEQNIRCVYDDCGAGFVFLYNLETNEDWITGMAGGSYGSDKKIWLDILNQMRNKHPDIPPIPED